MTLSYLKVLYIKSLEILKKTVNKNKLLFCLAVYIFENFAYCFETMNIVTLCCVKYNFMHLNFFHDRKYLFWNSYFEVKYIEKYFSYHEENILKIPLWNSGNCRYSISCKNEGSIFVSPLNKSFVHLRIKLFLE